jgi:hypothetical protein
MAYHFWETNCPLGTVFNQRFGQHLITTDPDTIYALSKLRYLKLKGSLGKRLIYVRNIDHL